MPPLQQRVVVPERAFESRVDGDVVLSTKCLRIGGLVTDTIIVVWVATVVEAHVEMGGRVVGNSLWRVVVVSRPDICCRLAQFQPLKYITSKAKAQVPQHSGYQSVPVFPPCRPPPTAPRVQKKTLKSNTVANYCHI